MKFTVKDTLTEKEIRYGLKWVMKDGMASQAMGILTGGVILIDFALVLGASNLLIGILAALPFLAHLIQIPSTYLVERVRLRRKITVFAAVISRSFLLFVGLVSFVSRSDLRIIFLILSVAFYATFAAVTVCSWNSWMRDLIPQHQLGSFFSKRWTAMTAIGIPLYLGAGLFLDWWKNNYTDCVSYGYSIIYLLGFLAGFIGIYFISNIPEPRMVIDEKKESFYKLILLPFRDHNFKKLLFFMGSWNFAVNLAAPFFAVYMLTRLELDLSFVIILGIMSQVMNLFLFRLWGKLSDRFSNKSVLSVSGPLLIFCIFAFTFTTLPEKYVLTIPLLIIIHIIMGISTAGVILASGNIGLKLAPKGKATTYLAAYSLVNSLAAGTAPVFGGLFADFFTERELSLTLNWHSPARDLIFNTLNFQQWDFFFFFAFLIGLYSIHRLAFVQEVGEVKERIIIKELVTETRRIMRNLSTVDGIRYMIQFPLTSKRTNRIRRRKKKSTTASGKKNSKSQ